MATATIVVTLLVGVLVVGLFLADLPDHETLAAWIGGTAAEAEFLVRRLFQVGLTLLWLLVLLGSLMGAVLLHCLARLLSMVMAWSPKAERNDARAYWPDQG